MPHKILQVQTDKEYFLCFFSSLEISVKFDVIFELTAIISFVIFTL